MAVGSAQEGGRPRVMIRPPRRKWQRPFLGPLHARGLSRSDGEQAVPPSLHLRPLSTPIPIAHAVFPALTFVPIIAERAPVRRAAGERLGKCAQVKGIALLERGLADPVLLGVVEVAQADGPAVRRLEGLATIGAAADVGAFERMLEAAGHAAVMPAHPRTMGRTRAPSAG